MVVPAAYVLLVRQPDPGRTEVLLQLRSGTGYMDEHWAAAAAGHVERGESVFDAARREAVEELGVEPIDLIPRCAMQRTAPDGSDDPLDERVDYFFTCSRWTGTPQVREPDKAADLRWYDLTALPDPVVPHERVVLESLSAGRVDPVLTFGF